MNAGGHLHIGVVHGVAIFATVIFFGFFWRVAAAHNADNCVGQAMSFLY